MTTASRPEAAAAPDLLGLTADLVAVASVSRQESALADLVAARLGALGAFELHRVGDNVVARTATGGERVVLAGHLDTVPPAGNESPRVEGEVLAGLGAADMKGGLAVMLALADAVDARIHAHGGAAGAARDVTLCFYAREEVARPESGLLEIIAWRPELLDGDAAVLLEPTGGVVEAGCQGVLRTVLRLGGRRAHAARPWVGENAVHRLAPVLALLAELPARRPTIEGCEYRESLIAVGVSGGIAGNVVPDLAELRLSYRFAPDRDPERALAALRELLEPRLDASRDELTVEDVAPAAAPHLTHPLLAALVTAAGGTARAKLGYTDVATFSARGVPAANFGPADPLLAHTPGEHVTRAELEHAYRVLDGWLISPPAPGG